MPWRKPREYVEAGGPDAFSVACLRELRHAELTFEHGFAPAVAPRVGLRQGFASSPTLFRWITTVVFVYQSAPKWCEKGYGVAVGPHLLHFVAWADDTWRMGKDTMELNATAARRRAGLTLRLCTRTRTQVRRRDQSKAEVPETYTALHAMEAPPFRRGNASG